MATWRLEPRGETPKGFSAIVTFVSLLLALVLGGLLMLALGVNPFAAYAEIVRGSLLSSYGLSETLVKAIPLTLTGLACLLAFKMQIWNIGAEGQLVMGALAATAVVRFAGEEASPALLVLMFVASSVAGGLWAALPGFLKARLNVNEIIATLMLNYVALNCMDYLLYGSWKDPMSMGFPMTAPFPEAVRLGTLFSTRLHGGVALALLLPVIAYYLLQRTRFGFEIRVIGENERTAGYAGMAVMRNIILVMFLSGAIAGLAGFGEVAGLQGRLSRGFAVGYGFTGIIVAWLSRLNPLALPFVACLMGVLLVGGDTLQVMMQLPLASVQVIQGVILFCALAGEVFCRYRPRRVVLPREAE